jgi:hypothetical protein
LDDHPDGPRRVLGSQRTAHRLVPILDQSCTLGGELFKIVELAVAEEPSAQRLL